MGGSKKILVLLNKSLGEIDTIFPLATAIQEVGEIKIDIIGLDNNVFDKFLKNNFYSYCLKNIPTVKSFKSLDISFLFKKRSFKNKVKKAGIYFIHYIKALKFLFSVINSDIILHEYDLKNPYSNFIYKINKIFPGKIYIFCHGQGILREDSLNLINKENYHPDQFKQTVLAFDNKSLEYYKKMGYSKVHTIGYTKFYKEWRNFIKKRAEKLDDKNHVVIYSRQIHRYYMDEEKYKTLFITSYNEVRKKLPKTKIIVKIHPRIEEPELIKTLIKDNRMQNIEISTENAGVLACNALFCISFWTAAIIDSFAVETPAIEYYIEADRFREIEVNGSQYKNAGIDSAKTPEELSDFIDKVIKKEYKTPEIINEIESFKNLSFLNF